MPATRLNPLEAILRTVPDRTRNPSAFIRIESL